MMLSATIVLRLGRRLGHGTIISVSGPNRPKYRYFGVAFRKFNEFTVSRKRIIYVLKFIIAIIIKCRDAVDDVGQHMLSHIGVISTIVPAADNKAVVAGNGDYRDFAICVCL